MTATPQHSSSTLLSKRKRLDLRRKVTRLLISLVLILFSLFALGPILLALLGSFKGLSDILLNPLKLPAVWEWQNYIKIWEVIKLIDYFKSSLILTLVAVPSILVVATLASFGLAAYTRRWSNSVYLLFIAGLIVPIQLTILPIVLSLKSLGLTDNYFGVILVYIATGQPFAIFLLTGFLRNLQSELLDAARIDGANDLQLLYYIALPLIRPAIAAVIVFYTVGVWNDFFLPYILATKIPTIQLAILELRGRSGSNWGMVFAGVLIAAAPMVILFLAMTEQFIKGLTAGALKG